MECLLFRLWLGPILSCRVLGCPPCWVVLIQWTWGMISFIILTALSLHMMCQQLLNGQWEIKLHVCLSLLQNLRGWLAEPSQSTPYRCFPTAICPYFNPWIVQLTTSQGLAGQPGGGCPFHRRRWIFESESRDRPSTFDGSLTLIF